MANCKDPLKIPDWKVGERDAREDSLTHNDIKIATGGKSNYGVNTSVSV